MNNTIGSGFSFWRRGLTRRFGQRTIDWFRWLDRDAVRVVADHDSAVVEPPARRDRPFAEEVWPLPD